MKANRTQLAPTGPTLSQASLGQRLRAIAAMRAEEILAEVAPTLRRIRTLLLVVTICVPVFVVGSIVAVWHLGH